MRYELLAPLPERPPSEVEWEELLFRLELMLRALRVLLEDIPDAGGRPALDAAFERMVRRELFVAHFLEKAAAPVGGLEESPGGMAAAGEDPVQLFVRLRTRNFAMVQRRGIDVWNWIGEVEGGGKATVFQVLTHLAAGDVAALAELRSHARPGTDAC